MAAIFVDDISKLIFLYDSYKNMSLEMSSTKMAAILNQNTTIFIMKIVVF